MPDVNGVAKVSGDPMFSVLVMFALVGVTEYVAANGGLTTEVPSSTVAPPVKLVIANAEPSEIVMVLPAGVQTIGGVQTRASAPVRLLRDVTPAAATAQV